MAARKSKMKRVDRGRGSTFLPTAPNPPNWTPMEEVSRAAHHWLENYKAVPSGPLSNDHFRAAMLGALLRSAKALETLVNNFEHRFPTLVADAMVNRIVKVLGGQPR